MKGVDVEGEEEKGRVRFGDKGSQRIGDRLVAERRVRAAGGGRVQRGPLGKDMHARVHLP